MKGIITYVSFLLLISCRVSHYNATYVLQRDYKDNTSELNKLRDLVDALPKSKNIEINKSSFYRCDNKAVKEFSAMLIDFNDEVYNKKNTNPPTCDNSNIQEWYKCCMKNFPFVKNDNDNILIFSSEKNDTIRFLKSTEEKSYPVFYSVDEIQKHLTDKRTKLKNNVNIIVFHYQYSISYCDTIGQYISRRGNQLKPSIFVPFNNRALHLKSSHGKFELKWGEIHGFKNYELLISDKTGNTMKFDITMEGSQNYAYDVYLEGDTVICRLAEHPLIEHNKEFNSSKDQGAAFDSLYQKLWNVKIRATACDDHYTPYSNIINDVQLICE